MAFTLIAPENFGLQNNLGEEFPKVAIPVVFLLHLGSL